ncbi:FtsB family cell division protein [Emergencia sp.]|uniref:FtsB family cell division protein n=1 Tax=Emergencia sp. TaxID=1926557 RepID=UPI003AF17531
MKKRKKGRLQEFERNNTQNNLEEFREERRKSTKKKKRIRINKVRIVVTVIVVVLIAVVGVSIKNVFDLRAEQDELRAKNKQLASEKASLKEELKNVNDYDYIEEQARIQLKLIRPGEILYVLDDEGTDTNGKDDN